jgi:peptide/nickel transport system substrate-binding protein
VFAGGQKERAAEEPAENILRIPGGESDRMMSAWTNWTMENWLIFRSLIKCDRVLQPDYPDLATKWTVSDDSLTYTFAIKSDVKWHDGEPFMPEDVKWSLGMACKAMVNAQVGNVLPYLVGYDEWVKQTEITDLSGSGTQLDTKGIVIDGNVITIKLTKPCSKFLVVLVQLPMLPRHILVNENPLTLHLCDFWINPVGTGPYKISLISPGSYTILEAFKGYDGPAPKIQKIQLVRVASVDVAILMAQNNKIDIHSVKGDVK